MKKYVKLAVAAFLFSGLSLTGCSKKGGDSSAPAKGKKSSTGGDIRDRDRDDDLNRRNDDLNTGLAQFVLDGEKSGGKYDAKLSVLNGNHYVIMYGRVSKESESEFEQERSRNNNEEARALVRTFKGMEYVAAIVEILRPDDRRSDEPRSNLYIFRKASGDNYDLLTAEIEVRGFDDIDTLQEGVEKISQKLNLSIDKTIELLVRTHREHTDLNLKELIKKALKNKDGKNDDKDDDREDDKSCGKCQVVVKPKPAPKKNCVVTTTTRTVERRRVVVQQPRPPVVHRPPVVQNPPVYKPAPKPAPKPPKATPYPVDPKKLRSEYQLVDRNGSYGWDVCSQSKEYIVLGGSFTFDVTREDRPIKPCDNPGYRCHPTSPKSPVASQTRVCCRPPIRPSGYLEEKVTWRCQVKKLGKTQRWAN